MTLLTTWKPRKKDWDKAGAAVVLLLPLDGSALSHEQIRRIEDALIWTRVEGISIEVWARAAAGRIGIAELSAQERAVLAAANCRPQT
jgi:hypothetical protein